MELPLGGGRWRPACRAPAPAESAGWTSLARAESPRQRRWPGWSSACIPATRWVVGIGRVGIARQAIRPGGHRMRPRPKPRAAASTIKGAGQRRNTASLLLELSARNGKSSGSLVASIRSVSIPTSSAQVIRHSQCCRRPLRSSDSARLHGLVSIIRPVRPAGSVHPGHGRRRDAAPARDARFAAIRSIHGGQDAPNHRASAVPASIARTQAQAGGE